MWSGPWNSCPFPSLKGRFPLCAKHRRREARTEVTVCTEELTVTALCSAVLEQLNREVARRAYR
jgi:hypothetical protein